MKQKNEYVNPFGKHLRWALLGSVLFWILVIWLCSCKKQSADCPTWTADTYAVAKTSGITPPTPGVVTFKDCTPYQSGQVILYREDSNFRYYRRIR